jgi:hypothetical protein
MKMLLFYTPPLGESYNFDEMDFIYNYKEIEGLNVVQNCRKLY